MYMEAPLTRLPPELLALVFEGLDKEERMLCTITRQQWQVLIKSLWPELEVKPEDMLYWAAKKGYAECLEMLRRWDLKGLTKLIINAVQNGNIRLCIEISTKPHRTTHEYPIAIYTLNKSLSLAARGGHIICMKILTDWGAKDFNWALNSAAGEGHINCLKFAKKRSDSCLDWAHMCATENNHLGCMKILRGWGAKDVNSLLELFKEEHKSTPITITELKAVGRRMFGWGAK